MMLKTNLLIFVVTVFLAMNTVDSARAAAVKVSKADCQQVIQHVPRPDVEYKPGVDVYGRKVVPADLGNPSPIKVPDVITFNITQNLNDLTGTGSTSTVGTVFGEPVIGQISIRGRQVYYNGKPLGGIDQSELIKKCRAALSGK